MFPEVGHFALIIAFVLAILMSIIPMVGALQRHSLWMMLGRPLAVGQFVFISISFYVLTYAFINDDFSVKIVANQSNSLLPVFYKITAVWGGHEGSMLLWIEMLALWTLLVALFSRQLPEDMVARVLSVMGMVSVGFLAFSLFTSNPFDRVLIQTPLDGRDLNPLLQDFAMALHPPLLYCGYVGFSVAFGFAIAALSSGQLDAAWARWSRPWTNIAWVFLTAGIVLGSWWAYYELGWGGWWFWDPVENASFMPWVVGTALVHSLAATEKRGVFKSWTVLLAIFAFSLSLLGTFLVRSGVLTSVHSFAADPARGTFILVLLLIVIGGSLTLFALRAPTVTSKIAFGGWSRELFLLINNVIFLVATITILLGTLFPLIMDALGTGKYSVGPPYFNAVFVPLMAILFAIMGPAVLSNWKQSQVGDLAKRLVAAAIASIAIGLVFPFVYAGAFNMSIVLAVTLACWMVFSGLTDLCNKLRHATDLVSGMRRLPASYYGMSIAHVGVAICVVGIAVTSQYSDERDVRMEKGDKLEVGSYTYHFVGTEVVRGPNYTADRATVDVYSDDKKIAELLPEKRRYASQMGNTMTEAAIDPGLFRDLYVAMGEKLEDGSWAVRMHYKPFVRWIWLGGLLMSLGATVAVADKRYRLRRAAQINASMDAATAKSATT